MFTEYMNHYPSLRENYKKLLNMINDYDEIIIMRHLRPDPDAIGSQLGLKEILKSIFPNKKVTALGESEASLEFLGKMDTATSVERPLLIVVDTAGVGRIDGDLSLGDKVVKIDHHPNHEPYGDLNIVETGVSSTSELIFLLADAWGFDNDYINDISARLLFSGIVGDTGRFLFNNTSTLTLKVASELRKFNFDASKDMTEMNKQSLDQFRFKGYLINNFRMTDKGVLYVWVPASALSEYGLTSNEASMHVNIYREIDEASIWFMAVEEEEDIRVRLRSKETVINDIAEHFGGGGHPLASGVSIASQEELKSLIEALDSKL
ncbi:bifunctional oligoribonuclease/PAP phosphatase NrnA [Salinicoccus hispanicus]|uniref:Bifunctional oligoribonuclease/PAP phosphatase NrnA n=1 Tax=Salinicoccus hispanicus TaxID=157225 RepID=A0A6N8U485_9STAP|nr:bifunctional oligoribonuclease/PAP phosphatase NrnA [Salinicoccus hispanicus]MXQ50449.1 bifunctional oligoribonuclease/PAP phosphatase NrnA [Salinicoccus hispanicus]